MKRFLLRGSYSEKRTWLILSSQQACEVSAVEVSTPIELFVYNGTVAKLPCTFKSAEKASALASATWSFRPPGSTAHPAVFFYYYAEKAYRGKDSQFKDRVTWVGNFSKKDASIKVANMIPEDNGTYICDVKNPPDIVVEPGQIEVKVLEKKIIIPRVNYTNITTSGKMAYSRATHTLFWSLTLKFCCALASFPNYLF
ncbi:myelin protein zero-like protein 1 [Hemicordylus capensis]|uniref:myelin protein zero-like protein 1 n=1 Tax=Hemicordylus capensis TaxID=884348 RepID=UPI002303B239|nr:myelin protein zero-like protein 1 [Hemicordylus capensis]